MQQTARNLSVLSDEDLIRQVCEGRVDAFDEIYLRYSPLLMRYFIRMLNYDRILAEDALQDLFLKIAQSPGHFNPQRSFKTWIYSVASNSCKNFYRHQQVKREFAEQANETSTHNDQEFFLLAAKMDIREFRKMLDEALALLPIEKKEAFLLKYVEEKTISEIAEIQDCPEGSVKSRIFYATKVLQEKLKIFKPVND